MKMHRAHRVPLSARAVPVLEAARTLDGSRLVFQPGVGEGDGGRRQGQEDLRQTRDDHAPPDRSRDPRHDYGTDFVFDGTASAPYGEDDTPNPQSVYGASELLGDWFAQEARAYVLRVESLFGGGVDGPSAGGRRFGGSLLDELNLRAPCPRFCALPSHKLAAAGIEMPHWPDAVARYARVRLRRRRRGTLAVRPRDRLGRPVGGPGTAVHPTKPGGLTLRRRRWYFLKRAPARVVAGDRESSGRRGVWDQPMRICSRPPGSQNVLKSRLALADSEW